jgi:hypothetical protein
VDVGSVSTGACQRSGTGNELLLPEQRVACHRNLDIYRAVWPPSTLGIICGHLVGGRRLPVGFEDECGQVSYAVEVSVRSS